MLKHKWMLLKTQKHYELFCNAEKYDGININIGQLSGGTDPSLPIDELTVRGVCSVRSNITLDRLKELLLKMCLMQRLHLFLYRLNHTAIQCFLKDVCFLVHVMPQSLEGITFLQLFGVRVVWNKLTRK